MRVAYPLPVIKTGESGTFLTVTDSTMIQTTWAVQPANWTNFDPEGAIQCADIDTAYKICQSVIGEGDQMIWKMTAGDPIRWVRVYEDESIDAVTDQHLAHLV